MSIKVKVDRAGFLKALWYGRQRIEKAVADAIEETDGPALVKEAYVESPLRVRSGRLYNSFTEKNEDHQKEVTSDVIYANIHNRGGVTGRNYKTIIKPTFYLDNALKKISEAIRSRIKRKLKK